jgi:hypothetical protein
MPNAESIQRADAEKALLEERLAVVTAYREGAAIESRRIGTGPDMWAAAPSPLWLWDITEYRRAPVVPERSRIAAAELEVRRSDCLTKIACLEKEQKSVDDAIRSQAKEILRINRLLDIHAAQLQGATIQGRGLGSREAWTDVKVPVWADDVEYRVKPE